jgi:hypothetical protein
VAVISDQAGNPLLDQAGNPLLDESGNPMSSLVDPFTVSDITVLWGNSFNSPVISGGRCALACSPFYTGLASTLTYTLAGSYAFVPALPRTGLSTGQTFLRLYVDGNNYVQLGYDGGNLHAQIYVGGTQTYSQTTTYNATTHAWWRIREQSGTIYFGVSSNGVSWTEPWSTTYTLTITALYGEVLAGWYGGSSGTLTGFETVDNGPWIIQCNEYNSAATLDIDYTTGAPVGFTIAASSVNVPNPGEPAAYPSVILGTNNYGTLTPGNPLPLLVSGIEPGQITTTMSVTYGAAGTDIYDCAQDNWFSTIPNPDNQVADELEFMIFLTTGISGNPAGSLYASGVSLSGGTFNVWFQASWANAGKGTVSFVFTSPQTAISLDYYPFMQYMIAQGWLSPSWYFVSVQAGFELWKGGSGLALDSLTVSNANGTSYIDGFNVAPPGPAADPDWLAARCGLPGTAAAVNEPSQVAQFLAAHAITPVYPGVQIVTPGGYAGYSGVDWTDLGISDVDQPFVMPSGSTAIGRVTLPLSPAGNGADVTVSLCANSAGSPGAVIASTRVPAAQIAQLAAPSGLGTGGPLATAWSNTMAFGAGTVTDWAQPAVSLNGAGSYAAPVTSGSYMILLGGYDATASATVATVSTVAYLGGQALSGPVPQPALPRGAWLAMAAATADTVIFAGGINGISYLANVWTASWDPATGTVGAWTAQTSLPAPVVSGGMAASGSVVYVAGGNSADSSATSTSAVWLASAVNGQIQAWTAGPTLPQAVSSPCVAAVNGWLVVAGGVNSSGTALTQVWCAPIRAGGSLGGWQAGPPLPYPAYAYSPAWNLAVTSDAIVIVGGATTGGATSDYSLALTVTADGPAPAWQAMTAYSDGDYQTACFQAAAGQWEVFNLNSLSYEAIPLVPVPLISVPLPAAGLISGGTYHIVVHQDGGDANDYTQAGLIPSALPIAAQTRPNGGGSWAGLADGYSMLAGVWDQTACGQVLHTWEDSGARITTMVWSGAYAHLLGICEGTAFEDGTMLPVVTEIDYNSLGLPAALVQLA